MANPLISTLQDGFSGATLNTTLWNNTSGGVSVTGGVCQLVSGSTTASLGEQANYNFTGSAIFVNIVPSAPTDPNQVTSLVLQSPFGLSVYITRTGANTVAQADGADQPIGTSNDPNNTWWRLRELNGSVYCDLSADGLNWTSIGSAVYSPSFDPTTVTVTIESYYGTGQPAAGWPTVAVDNVNMAPVAPTPTGTYSPAGQSNYSGDPTKNYLWKIYKSDGTFLSTWKDVASEPQFTQQINTPGTTMVVHLARSPDTTAEQRNNLVTASGNQITDKSGDPYVVKSQVNNTVGSGSDVDLNYNVECYVVYGGFANLVTASGNQIVDQNGNPYVVAVGAPLGTRIFSGFILDYELAYNNDNGAGVTLTVASNGYELSQNVIKQAGTETTTVDYSSTATEAATVASSLVNTNPGRMSVTSASVPTTGVAIKPLFRLNTKEEGLQMVVDQLGSNYYWYGSPADNLVYIKPIGTAADHTFVLGKHLSTLKLSRSMEQLANDGYFVGGTPSGSSQLYKHYTSSDGSLTAWRRGLWRHTDQRYLLTSSTDGFAASMFAKFSQPIFTSTIEISAGSYDIETIKLGQMVRFRNSGNSFIDSLLLQIVNRSYTPYKLTLDLGQILASQSQIVTDLEAQADTTAQIAIPNTPS